MKCFDELMGICKLCHQLFNIGLDDSDDDFEPDDEEHVEQSVLLAPINMNLFSFPAACSSNISKLEDQQTEPKYRPPKSYLTVKHMNKSRLKSIIVLLMKDFYQSSPRVAVDAQEPGQFLPFIKDIYEDIDPDLRQALDSMSTALPDRVLKSILKKIKLDDYFEQDLLTSKRSNVIAKRKDFRF